MKIFKYLISKSFLKNIGIIICAIIILIFSIFMILNVYTNHGEAISVPDFTGLTINEVEKIIIDKNLQFKVVDSIYTDKVERGAVIDQVPKPDHKVKNDRIIFITINSFLPQRVQIPNFLDLELRSANALAETYGLKINVEKFVPDISTTVLKQKYKGKEIKVGTWIEKHTIIDVIVGRGRSSEKVLVPNILGFSKEDAENKLSDLALMIGIEDYDESVISTDDSLNAKIYNQSPRKYKNSEIRIGSTIDIWLTIKKEIIPEPDTLNIDENNVSEEIYSNEEEDIL